MIGLCDATDSELSIRHLALTPREGKINFYLSPQSCQTLATKAAAAKARSSGGSSSGGGCSSIGGGGACSCTADDSIGAANSTDSLTPSDQSDYESKRNNHCDIILDITNNNSSNRASDKCIATSTLTTTLTTGNERPACGSGHVCGNSGESKIACAIQKTGTRYHSTALSRVRNESIVSRSKSFQEQGVRSPMRSSRFFVKRQQQLQANDLNDYNSDTASHQNIEITVEDTDPYSSTGYGNSDDHCHTNSDSQMDWQRLCDDKCSVSGSMKHYRRWTNEPFRLASKTITSTTQHLFEMPTYDDVKSWGNGHILGRIFRRMRKISFGWRKSKCKVRRGDCVLTLILFFSFVFVFLILYRVFCLFCFDFGLACCLNRRAMFTEWHAVLGA